MELLVCLPIENRTAFPGLFSLLWHFRCWLQNHYSFNAEYQAEKYEYELFMSFGPTRREKLR